MGWSMGSSDLLNRFVENNNTNLAYIYNIIIHVYRLIIELDILLGITVPEIMQHKLWCLDYVY